MEISQLLVTKPEDCNEGDLISKIQELSSEIESNSKILGLTMNEPCLWHASKLQSKIQSDNEAIRILLEKLIQKTSSQPS